MVSSKMCATCFEAEHANNEPVPHVCPRNYNGISKGMEAYAALNSYKELRRLSQGTTTLEHIVADDDSSMRSLLRHKSNNYPKGALPLDLPEPQLLADPTHRTKIIAKPFFALVALGKSETDCTNVDAQRIKQWWGYMIKFYCDYPIEVVRKQAKAIFQHLFDNHEYYDVKWCKPLRLLKQ